MQTRGGWLPIELGFGLMERGWAGAEAGMACEAGSGAGARRDHGDRSRVSRAWRGGGPGGPRAEARRGEAAHSGAGDPLQVALGAASTDVDHHSHGLDPIGLDRERDLVKWIIEAVPIGVTLDAPELDRGREVPGCLAGSSGHGALPPRACWSVILRFKRGRRHGRIAVFPRSSTGREALAPRPRARGGPRPRQGLPRHLRSSWPASCPGTLVSRLRRQLSSVAHGRLGPSLTAHVRRRCIGCMMCSGTASPLPASRIGLWNSASRTQAALGSCRDRPSSAPVCRRATWWRTAPSVTPRSRAMWLLLAPRAAKVLMVMRASGLSRFILASAPRNSAVRRFPAN